MGKKRKATGASAPGPKGPKEFDPKDSRLPAVTTFADIADSEEEYFLNQDQILFNDGPQSKKQKRLEEEAEFMEDSEEEIFEQDDELDDDEDGELQEVAAKSKKTSKKRRGASEEPEVDGSNDEGQESGWWGSSRKEYYLNDQIQTEEDALMEEQEAIRLQKKKLAKMSEDDFIFNEDTWLTEKTEDAGEAEVVTEKLVSEDVDISDLSTEERIRLLHSRYPELDYLAEELLELQPLLVTLQEAADGKARKSVAVVKYRVLGCYVATLALYFAALTSPTRDSGGPAKALDPAELRDHEVMGTLLECREAWLQVKDLKALESAEAITSPLSPPGEDAISFQDADEASVKPTEKASKAVKEKKTKTNKAERRAKQLEESLADLSSLVTAAKRSKKVDRPEVTDNNSDFGEEETLNSRAAAEKAARRKSLRFYTSQIVQKANKRAGAGAAAGGDVDIPYRERLRDRQARLNAEAAKRGQKDSKAGVDLGGESDDDDRQVASAVKGDEDEYYDMVTNKKKAEKALKTEALAAANKREWIEEEEETGKRAIGRTIMKNQGLAPKRKKDVRNPRVKKRNKYEKQKKKLGSMKAVFKGGEGKGGYGGEKTGIKSGLIKSVKL